MTKVRREATVTAIEPCHLVQLTAQACSGLSVQLDELLCHIVGHMLEKVSFFASLNQTTRLAVARLLEIEYVDRGTVIFSEGSPGDKFYVLNEGRIGIYEGMGRWHVDALGVGRFVQAESAPAEEKLRLLGEFRPDHPYPWFGEMALYSNRPRAWMRCQPGMPPRVAAASVQPRWLARCCRLWSVLKARSLLLRSVLL